MPKKKAKKRASKSKAVVETHQYAMLNPWGLGSALGIVWGLTTCIIALISLWGHPQVVVGTAVPTIVTAILGFILGSVIALLYNCLISCNCFKFCRVR